jgi:flagellar basal-body rod modification protein FlgD
MPITGVTAASTGAASSQTSATQGISSVDSNTFLQLLVAQLKYQDPMNPAQGTEFLAQTAQFSMVEKLNTLAQQSTDALAAQRVVEATSMVGSTVTYSSGSGGGTASGVVSGVQLLASGPVLVVGGTSVPLSSVTAVSVAPTA